MATLEALQAALDQLLPLELVGGELSLGSPLRIEDGRLLLTLRMATIDDGSIIDMREQEVALGHVDAHSPARWQAYIEGTLRAAPAIVAALGGVDAIMPWDVFVFEQVLDDPSLATADEFAAELGDPERLAVWVEQLDDDAWRGQLESCGLGDRVEQVRALLRPSLRLRLEPVDDEEDPPEPGSTRLGGDPDEAAAELLREGLLSLFYSPFPPDGYGLEHPVFVRTFDPAMLELRPSPRPGERLRPHTISFEEESLLPAVESVFHYEALLPNERVRDFYASLARGRAGAPTIDFAALSELVVERSMCDFERPAHRLLGHPASIQGDPYIDVEMCRKGWDSWQEGTEAAMAARQRSLNWRLLLQVDAVQDGELLLNQDGGFFYFWMPADALAKHDWTRAKGCLQCH